MSTRALQAASGKEPEAIRLSAGKAAGQYIFTDTAGGGLADTYTKEELAKAVKEKEKEIKELELNVREQELKLRQSQKAVDEGQVKAKLNGVVKTVGDPQNPPKDGSPFLTIVSTEGLYVQGYVSELKLDTLKEGSTVSIMSYQSGTMCDAVVKEVSPYPSTGVGSSDGAQSSMYPFTAYIAEGGEMLQNNEYVQITLNETMSEDMGMGAETISLSKAFIREEDGRKYVYKKDEDGKLKRQEIETGRVIWGDNYEINSGLSTEDWIAFPYGKNIRDGAKTVDGTLSELYGY